MRTLPFGVRGSLVRPAPDEMISMPAISANRSASWKPSCVPPRMRMRMSVEARAGHHPAVAIIDQHLDRDLAVDLLHRDLLRLGGDRLGQRHILLLCDAEGLARRVGLGDELARQ